jgi:hypothetical protein
VEESTEHTKPDKKVRKKRWWLKTIYFLVAVFIIIDAFLFFLATPLLKTYLQNKVYERTEGLFSIDFEKISLELSTRRLALKGFELTSDTAVYNRMLEKKEVKAALYNISCNSIELWGTNVYRLLSKGKLKANELKLEDPVIELKKLPGRDTVEQESRDFVHEDLYPAISKYLNEVWIKKIILDNGKFLLKLDQDSLIKTTHLGYVSVHLFDFLLNEETFLKKEKLFYANDLQLNLTDYKVSLSDKVHFIYADSVDISTKSSKLIAKNVGMQPINQSPGFLDDINKNYFQISSPTIELRNFNIHELYFKSDIKIGQIDISSPAVKVVNKLKRSRKTKSAYNQTMEIDLSNLIAGKLNSVKIDTLNINDGELGFFHQSWLRSPTYKARHFSLNLFKFYLYENAGNDLAKVFYSDSIRLALDTFSARLPDKVHLLNAKSITISSGTKIIEATGLSLRAIRKKRTGNSLNIRTPRLKITGVNFHRLYHNRILNIAGLYISPSDFKLKLWQKQQLKNDSVEKKSPLAILTTNFVRQLSIRRLNLKKSSFDIDLFENDSTSYSYKGSALFELKRFFASNATFANDKSPLFYSDQFKLVLNNFQQDLKDKVHVLKAKSVEISTIDSLVEVAGFKIFPKDKNTELKLITENKIYDIDLIQAYIRGIDINKAYNDSNFSAKSISLLRPNIKIFNNQSPKRNFEKTSRTSAKRKNHSASDPSNASTFKRLISSYFKRVNLNTFNIDNANIKVTDFDRTGRTDLVMKGKLSARINKFYFNPIAQAAKEQISYSDNFSFRITDYFGKLFQKNYQLKFKRARFSSRDSILTASVVRLFPTKSYENSDKGRQLFSFYAPTIESRGIKINDLIDKDIINLGKLTIENPSLALTQKNTKKENTTPLLTKTDSVRKAMNIASIKFNEINIKDGVFGILKESFNLEKLTSHTKLNLSIKNLELDTFVLANPKEIFSTLDAQLLLTETHFQLPDSLHFIDLDTLMLNTNKKQITAQNFAFTSDHSPGRQKKRTSLEELIIPELSFDGFELGNLITDRTIFSDKIYLEEPQISISVNKRLPGTMAKISQLNLYEKIRKSFRAVNLNHINANNASLNYHTIDGFKSTNRLLDQLFANISGLIIDSLHQNDGRLLSADDISLNIKNQSLNFSDSLYHLTIKDLGFSTGKKSVFAKGIFLNPNYGRQEYADLRQKEINLSYLKTSELKAENVNFHRFLDNREFIADRTNLDRVQFHAYKYKQYPMDSVQKIALPLNYIWKAKNRIKIDTLKITNSYIGHDILGKNAMEDGFLDFTRVNIEMLNLTNDSLAIANEEDTKIKASAYLMDEALLTSSFHFPIASKYGEYVYGGHLDTFNMSSVNPLLENLLFVTIQDGTINSLDFNVVANEDYSTGKLIMLYDDLKLGLLSKKKSDSLVVEKRGLFSMVANSIVRDKNPRRKAIGPKKGRVYFERNPYRSIFNYWTFSLLSGMQSTLGFKSKQLKERLKIEKDSSKLSKKDNKKNYRLTKKSQKVYDKQIEQELKDQEKYRKKEERQEKKGKRKNKKPATDVAFLKPENEGIIPQIEKARGSFGRD